MCFCQLLDLLDGDLRHITLSYICWIDVSLFAWSFCFSSIEWIISIPNLVLLVLCLYFKKEKKSFVSLFFWWINVYKLHIYHLTLTWVHPRGLISVTQHDVQFFVNCQSVSNLNQPPDMQGIAMVFSPHIWVAARARLIRSGQCVHVCTGEMSLPNCL